MDAKKALVIGIGAPVVTGLLSGMLSKSEDVKAHWRLFGIAALSTFAVYAISEHLMPTPVVQASVPCPPESRSVSGSWVRLGRQGGGVNYPGQMYGTPGASEKYPPSYIVVD